MLKCVYTLKPLICHFVLKISNESLPQPPVAAEFHPGQSYVVQYFCESTLAAWAFSAPFMVWFTSWKMSCSQRSSSSRYARNCGTVIVLKEKYFEGWGVRSIVMDGELEVRMGSERYRKGWGARSVVKDGEWEVSWRMGNEKYHEGWGGRIIVKNKEWEVSWRMERVRSIVKDEEWEVSWRTGSELSRLSCSPDL